MSSVTCFSLDHSKFWFSGNGLNGYELKSRHQTGKKISGEMEKLLVTSKFSFLTQLSTTCSGCAIVIDHCPASVRPSVREQLLKKSSPLKPPNRFQ